MPFSAFAHKSEIDEYDITSFLFQCNKKSSAQTHIVGPQLRDFSFYLHKRCLSGLLQALGFQSAATFIAIYKGFHEKSVVWKASVTQSVHKKRTFDFTLTNIHCLKLGTERQVMKAHYLKIDGICFLLQWIETWVVEKILTFRILSEGIISPKLTAYDYESDMEELP